MKLIREAAKKYNTLEDFWHGFFYESDKWKSWWKELAPDYFYLDNGNRYCRMRYGVFADTLEVETEVVNLSIKNQEVKVVYADRRGITIYMKSGSYIGIG